MYTIIAKEQLGNTINTTILLTLNRGATHDLSFVNATDIDSSAGTTIYTYKGTLSNATNWNVLSTNPAVAGKSY